MAAVIGAGVGAVYGGVIAGPGARALLDSLLISIPIGVIDALLTAAWIAGIELFLLSRASMQWLDALPFAAVFVLSSRAPRTRRNFVGFRFGLIDFPGGGHWPM